MPESKCTMCGKWFHGDDNELKDKELYHHKTYMVSQVDTDSGVVDFHFCRCFYIYNDNGNIEKMRTYAHGIFAEEENLI